MAKAATPATKKVATPRPKAPAKAAATKAAPARKPVAAKAAKDHPIRDQIAATRDTIKSEASKKAASLKQDATTLKNQDRKSVVEGKCVSVRVDLGGPRVIKKKKKRTNN